MFGASQAHLGQLIDDKKKIRSHCLELGFSDETLWRMPQRFVRRELQQLLRHKSALEIRPPKNRVLYRNGSVQVAYTEKIRATTDKGASFYGLSPFIEVRRSKREPLDEYRQLAISLEAYLSFLTRRRIERTTVRYSFGPRTLINPWIGLQGIWARSRQGDASEGAPRDMGPVDKFFSLREAHSSYQSSLSVWLDNYRTFFPVYVLFLSAINRGTTVDESLFSLIQACEAFHQRTTRGRHDLTDIVESMVKNTFPAAVKHIGDPRKFGDKVRRMRNYYAHYDHRKGSYPYTGDELADTWRKVRLVFDVNILRWMKLTQSDIEACVRRVWSYSHVV